MKNFWKKLPLLAALVLAPIFAACSNSSAPDNYSAAITDSPFSKDALSHRAYIGGSLIYNPNSAALSQLGYGVKIAVRTSVLEKKSVSMNLIGSGSTLRTDETVSIGESGTWS